MSNLQTQTVFLFGAGALENPWSPVISAIREHHPEAGVQNAAQGNHYLAWWVYAQRLRARGIEKGDLSPEKQVRLDRMKKEDNEFRTLIADHLVLATADKTYQLRAYFARNCRMS